METVRMFRLYEDLICIILLLFIPESVLRATGLYRSIYLVAKERGYKDG